MHNLREVYLQAIYKVLNYLKGITRNGILFKKNERLVLKAYTYADYADSIVDKKAAIGYCTLEET